MTSRPVKEPAARQLTLDLPVRTALGRGDFLVAGPNAEAAALIDAWPDWPLGGLVLVGPESSGKSHLAEVWRKASGAMLWSGEQEPWSPDEAVPQGLVIEDADRVIAGDSAAQTTCFHIYNQMRAAGGALLLTARTPPARWGLTLPDLDSRLATLPVTTLSRPDDTLLSGVLVKLFADRQIKVEPAVLQYLLLRMDRSLAAATRLVAALDHAALERRQPVTRTLASEILSAAGPDMTDCLRP